VTSSTGLDHNTTLNLEWKLEQENIPPTPFETQTS